ncbi:cbp4 domain-containing protein [Botrytis cinerea]
MPPKPTNWRMYGKMAVAGLTCCVGGPALIYYISPTEEELFLKYNPELQKRSLENRVGKQEDFDNFVARLKEYSKSDRPSKFLSWVSGSRPKKPHAKKRSGKIEEQAKLMQEMQQRKEEIKKSGTNLMPGGSL